MISSKDLIYLEYFSVLNESGTDKLASKVFFSY